MTGVDVRRIIEGAFGSAMAEWSILFVHSDEYSAINDVSHLPALYQELDQKLGLDMGEDLPWSLKAVNTLGGNELALGYIKGFIGPEHENQTNNFIIDDEGKVWLVDIQTGKAYAPKSLGPVEVVII